MSLILAVEPDRRQAAHLTQIVRQRVGSDLILAETTELALAQIGNRVPDLILVPALLSPPRMRRWRRRFASSRRPRTSRC